ncbi:ABC transporter substrate-binding protein [Chloroflexota bacterium]
MKKVVVILLAVLLVGTAAGCSSWSPPAGDLVDDLGRPITVSETPQRIVSHVPSITEILFALDLGDKVVGVSTFCDYPPEAILKEKVGDFWSPSVEIIVAMEPDLVFTTGDNEPFMAKFDSLGIPCIALQPEDMGGVLWDIEVVGRVTNTEKQAEELTDEMRERISSVISRVEGVERPGVFYIVDSTDMSAPWTAGPGSFIDSMITMAGGRNIGGSAKVRWAEFSIEEVVSSDPEIIIIPADGGVPYVSPEELVAHPVWGKMTAVLQGRVFIVDDDLVSLYGPRVVMGLEEMAKVIHPELFE